MAGVANDGVPPIGVAVPAWSMSVATPDFV